MTKYQTPQSKIDQYCANDCRFATIQEFEKALREKSEGFMPDYIAISGVLFTMEEYDMDGKTVIYGNQSSGQDVYVETANRYKSATDAVVSLGEAIGRRNDITYAD